MNKPELLKALDALKAEVEKKPEDRVLEKLEEILKAIQALPHYYPSVCPYHHHPYPYITYPQITWTSPTTVTGTLATASTWSQESVSGHVVVLNASGVEA